MSNNSPQNDSKNLLMRLFLTFLLTILTYYSLGMPIRNGLDYSWMFALNYLHLHSLIGTQAFFTYGPFGFLLYPEPIGNNLFISNSFLFLTRFILILTSLELITALHKDKKPIYQLLTIGFLILLITLRKEHMVGFDYMQLFFITTNLILLFNCNQTRKVYLYLAALVATFSFLISPGYSLYSFLALYSYLIIFSLKFKNYKLLSSIILIQIICYLILWAIFVSHTLSGSLNYLIISHQFIMGNSDSMSLNPINNWFYIAGMLIFALSSLLVFNRKNIFAKDGLIIPVIFVLPIFAAFKYSYGREVHTFFMLFFLIWTFLYWLMTVNNYKKIFQLVLLGSIALTFFLLSRADLNIPTDIIYKKYPNLYIRFAMNFDRIRDFKNDFFNYHNYKQSLLKNSSSFLEKDQLPKNWLKIIGNQPVDIYPEELTVIAANNLNWQPRPIIQAYVSYTPYLDHLNAQHFSNEEKAPKYLVWYLPQDFYNWYFAYFIFIPEISNLDTTIPITTKKSDPWLLNIDFKYSLNAEPNTIYQILKWYKLILAKPPNAYLFERQQQPLLSEPTVLNTEETKWNTWIAVPKVTDGIIRTKLITQQTLLLKLKRMAYKLDDIWIDYKFDDRSIITNRLVLATAVNGIWVSPYKKNIYEITPYFHLKEKGLNKKVVAIRLRHSPYDLFKENITLTWEYIKWIK